MKVLITGGSGLLGSALLRSIPEGFEVAATYRSAIPAQISGGYDPYQLDLCDRDLLMNIIDQVSPELVIHTASIGNVDYCEQHPEESRQVNVLGTHYIIEACISHHCRLIYTSSNAVFDGDHAPYAEGDQPNPKHQYGKTKLAAEQLILASGLDAAIIRPILMYGWHTQAQRSNFVTWLLGELSQENPVRLLDDVYCNPIPVSQCAEAIWVSGRKKHTGLFHIAGKDRVSMYELGLAVARIFGFDTARLQPVSRNDLPQLVHRPADTTYRTDKMERVLGLIPRSLREGLKQMKEESRA